MAAGAPTRPCERWIAARLVDFCGEVDRGDGVFPPLSQRGRARVGACGIGGCSGEEGTEKTPGALHPRSVALGSVVLCGVVVLATAPD